ncbi:Ras-specific guanine nucleotide-releasing factor 2 [Balamuthia mandrillaris]
MSSTTPTTTAEGSEAQPRSLAESGGNDGTDGTGDWTGELDSDEEENDFERHEESDEETSGLAIPKLSLPKTKKAEEEQEEEEDGEADDPWFRASGQLTPVTSPTPQQQQQHHQKSRTTTDEDKNSNKHKSNTTSSSSSLTSSSSSAYLFENNVEYNVDAHNNGRKTIISGTPSALLNHILSSSSSCSCSSSSSSSSSSSALDDEPWTEEAGEAVSSAKVFLLTHPIFTTSEELLLDLVDVFNEARAKEDAARQNRVLRLLESWLKWFPEDFLRKAKLLPMVEHWSGTLKPPDRSGEVVLEAIKKLRDALKEKMEQEEKAKEEETTRRMEESIDISNIDIMSFTPEQFAQQLTIKDSILFSSISRSEFFNSGWTKTKTASKNSPTILTLIKRFNMLSYWMQTQIMQREDILERAACLSQVIRIGMEFQKLQNFQGMMIINSVLSAAGIERIHRTWQTLASEDMAGLAIIQDFFSPEGNFEKYRKFLQSCEPPLIPFLGAYLSDLIFIDENETFIKRRNENEEENNNETETEKREAIKATVKEKRDEGTKAKEEEEEEQRINFMKMELVTKILQNLIKSQQPSFEGRFEPIRELQAFLSIDDGKEEQRHIVSSDKELYQLSLKVEPRQRGLKGEKKASIKRRLAKTPRGTSSPRSHSYQHPLLAAEPPPLTLDKKSTGRKERKGSREKEVSPLNLNNKKKTRKGSKKKFQTVNPSARSAEEEEERVNKRTNPLYQLSVRVDPETGQAVIQKNLKRSNSASDLKKELAESQRAAEAPPLLRRTSIMVSARDPARNKRSGSVVVRPNKPLPPTPTLQVSNCS